MECWHTGTLSDLTKYLVSSQGGVINPVVQVSDVAAPILQVQDALPGGTIIQMPEGSMASMVQMADQGQPVYITEGFPNGIQILDGSIPFIQSSDGTSIIQLAAPSMVSGGSMEGLTQIVQLAGGHVALVEQPENLDISQNVQYVLEQVPLPSADHMEGEMQHQQQILMDTAAPEHVTRIDAIKMEETKPPIGKGPFSCDICEKKLEKWNQYQRHMRQHEDDKPFRCFNCPASFNIADNLKLHLATHVEPGDKPMCPECGKQFSRVASLKFHIMMHEKEENLMCSECGDEFSLQGQLDKHMLDHQEDRDGTRVFSCRQCNATFNTQKELKEHTKQHFKIKMSMSHRTYKREIDRTGFSHKCKHCSKSFQKPSQLERHVRVHTGDRPYKCTVCTKAFNQKGALQIHILGRHTNKKPHKCQLCHAGFSQKGNLRAHIQRVHTVTDKGDAELFRCEECPCIFKKLGSLNAHISKFHTGNANNEREQTEKEGEGDGKDTAGDVIKQLMELSEGQTSQNQTQQGEDDILQQALQNSGLPGNVNQNSARGTVSVMNVRDTATGVVKKHFVRKLGSATWHQCSYCMKEFKKPSDLVRHTRIHSHEKPYKCTQCFRAFAVKSTLNSHIRTHTGIKMFKCDACDKSFSTHGSLKVHMRLHTGAKPYDCSYCDKKFRTQAHRKTHIAQHFKGVEKGPVRLRSDPGLKKLADLQDIPLQEPILITDTGYIQQPPRRSVFNTYLGESSSVDRPYKCQFCQRGFKKSSHLKQHIRSHTGEKPYKCLTCTRTFVSNGVLKAHIRIHTGLKQYKCIMCENLFSTSGSLKRHMSTHSDVRPFMCPYCQRTFKTNVNCKKHMKTHRAELAAQTMADQSMTSQTAVQNAEQIQATNQAVQLVQEGEQYVEEEPVDSDLTLVQQELNQQTSMQQGDLGQQTMLSQAGLTDPLGLDSNILNQQPMFSQQQTFTQSLLDAGQNNLQQITGIDQQQNQFNMQSQQINQMDLLQQPQQTGLQIGSEAVPAPVSSDAEPVQTSVSENQSVTSDGSQFITTSEMPSTSMQNILETREESEPVEGDEAEGDADGLPTEPEPDEPEEEVDDGIKRPYVCGYCSRRFRKSSHLKQHIRSHTGERPYKCTQCAKQFVSMGVLRQHVRTHTGVKEFKCNICNAMFSTNGSLTRHMSIHVALKPYKCPFCLEGFRTASICKKHMKEHENEHRPHEPDPAQQHSDDDEPGATVTRRRRASRKNKIVDPSQLNKSSQALNLSEKILVESASERNRISELKDLSQLPQEKHPHECPHCPKSFKKPSDLVRHIRIHTGEKPFTCNLCFRNFTVKSTLDSHMKTHGGSEKTISCHICNSMFSTKGSLKVHMRLHTGAKPFKCPHCPQRFRTSGHRKSHILTHYKENGAGRRKKHFSKYELTPDKTMEFINQVDGMQGLTGGQTQGQMSMGQVINLDQSVLGGNMVPLQLTVDGYGNVTDNSMLQLQGLEGLQLQLPGGNLAGIQITGLDQSSIGQTVHIDANILQQLQSGNFNITLNSNQQQSADANLVQSLGNIQLQPMSIADGLNPSMIVQSIGGINVDQTGLQQGSQAGQMGVLNQDLSQGTFVMASNGDILQDQEIVTQGHVENDQQLEDTEVEKDEALEITNTIEGLTTDMDHDTSEMKAIDPNMATELADNITVEVNQVASDSEDVGDDDLDDHNIEESVEEANDEEKFHTPDLTTRIMPVSGMDSSSAPLTQEGNVTDRQFQCHICQKTFKRNSHLKEHINTHTRMSELMKAKGNFHACPFCTKRFQKPSQMERHIRIHTGERPFSCSICGKAFNQKNALQIHLKKHSGERPHKCPYCNTAFTQKGNLKTHIKRAHHAEMVSSMSMQKSGEKIQCEAEAGEATNDSVTDKEHVITQDINLGQVADLFNNN